MDVLQLVKRQHETIRAWVNKLESAETITDKRKACNGLGGLVAAHLRVESGYLLPEVTAVDVSASRIMDACLARHKHVLSDMKKLEKVVNKRPQAAKATVDKAVTAFVTELRTHLAAFEDEVLPRIRQRIPTQEREDLGVALTDVLAEELEGLGITAESPTAAAAAM